MREKWLRELSPYDELGKRLLKAAADFGISDTSRLSSWPRARAMISFEGDMYSGRRVLLNINDDGSRGTAALLLSDYQWLEIVEAIGHA